jgi:hypothetical protein
MKKILKNISALTGLCLALSCSANAQVTTANTANNYAATAYVGSSSTSTFKDIVFKTNSSAATPNERMRILGANGYIGFRVVSGMAAAINPQHPFHFITNEVPSPSLVSGMMIENSTANDVQLRFKSAKDVSAIWSIGTGSSGLVSGDDFYIWKEAGSGGAKLVIKDNGSVGIGTVNPDAAYKLSVKGGIRCEKVVVEIGWADYVFHKDYKLMPLNELEKFISSNKHLPNIPAASEVETKGLDVGAVQAKQMEKIEELTLYIIEMNKKMKEQNERVAQLEKKLEEK